MIFLVNDANILIDLLKIDLLDSFFQLELNPRLPAKECQKRIKAWK